MNKRPDKNQPYARFLKYYKSAEARGIPFTLTEKEFMALWQKSCSYCGAKIETIGLTRIHVDKGYTSFNTIACCAACNKQKSLKSDKQYIQWREAKGLKTL